MKSLKLGMLLVLVVVPVLPRPMPVAAQDSEFPGVNGNYYQSPNYGFTLAWDPGLWSVQEAGSQSSTDSLSLSSAKSDVRFTAYPRDAGSVEAVEECVNDEVDSRMNAEGVREVREFLPESTMPGMGGWGVIASDSIAISRMGSAGRPADDAIVVRCASSDSLEFVLQITYVTLLSNIFVSESRAWTLEFDHLVSQLMPPQAGWGGQGGMPSSGVLELELHFYEFEGEGENYVYVIADIQNVDIIESTFDVRNFHLMGDPVDIDLVSYHVIQGAPPDAGPVFLLLPDETIRIEILFPSEGDSGNAVCYQKDGRCVALQGCMLESGCGAGARPRISP